VGRKMGATSIALRVRAISSISAGVKVSFPVEGEAFDEPRWVALIPDIDTLTGLSLEFSVDCVEEAVAAAAAADIED
jgi:hypothetical protein